MLRRKVPRPLRPEDAASLLRRSLDDADAFADFYGEYVRGVSAFVMRRVYDAEVALDLTSETFAVAFERRRQFRGRTAGEEQAWLYAIARNLLLHYWRRGGVERAAMARLGIETPPLTDEDIERLEQLADTDALRREVATALDNLPADQAYAVRQRVLCERSYAEVAAELGQSEQTIRARVSRGLRAIGASIEESPTRGQVPS
ncbi:MAG TPA: RNA polymerase sigma factor [Solirubrobacteraceae bacterium]